MAQQAPSTPPPPTVASLPASAESLMTLGLALESEKAAKTKKKVVKKKRDGMGMYITFWLLIINY